LNTDDTDKTDLNEYKLHPDMVVPPNGAGELKRIARIYKSAFIRNIPEDSRNSGQAGASCVIPRYLGQAVSSVFFLFYQC